MPAFCTYFDRHYLTRGLTLIRSLARCSPGTPVYALCLDDQALETLTRLAWPEVHPVPLAELERADPVFHATSASRSRVEYYFTSTPAWIRYVMQGVPPGDVLAYVDADLFFYSPPAPVFAAMGPNSVAIVPHRFPDGDSEHDVFGLYNVGFVAFRNDPTGQAVLTDWRTRCIEWCYDYIDEDRFGDQKYLDAWPQRFTGIQIVHDPGVGLAPWNWTGHAIDPAADPPTVDGRPLVFYHFHAYRRLGRWWYDSGLMEEPMPRAVHARLYDAYAATVRGSRRLADAVAPGAAREIPHRRDGAYNYFSGLLRQVLGGGHRIHRIPRAR